jgi:hypothetical protein
MTGSFLRTRTTRLAWILQGKEWNELRSGTLGLILYRKKKRNSLDQRGWCNARGNAPLRTEGWLGMRWWIFDYDGKLSSHTDYTVGVDSSGKRVS